MKKNIYITEVDCKRIEQVIEIYQTNKRMEEHIVSLEKELALANIVAIEDMPNFIITMNSKVLIKNLDNNECLQVTIVYPKFADINANKISILAPLGVALIGQQIGDVVEVHLSDKEKILYSVENILYQPEEEGNYDE